MFSPLIGLTCSRIHGRNESVYHAVPEAYIQALLQAGATPLVIPLGVSPEMLQGLSSRFDAILFTGGGDVRPERYHSKPHPMVSEMDDDRDRIELQLFEYARKSRLPMLGICRGLQLFNVAMGGTLFEDILDQRPASIKHSLFPENPRDYLGHQIELNQNSHLSQILGESSFRVNSMHHQGIERLGDGLISTGVAEDGLVEAIELADYSFGLAVQWHPECMLKNSSMPALFRAFIEAAGNKEAA